MVVILILVCQCVIFERSSYLDGGVTNTFQVVLILLLIAITIYTMMLIFWSYSKGDYHLVIAPSALKSMDKQSICAILFLSSFLRLEKDGQMEFSMDVLKSRMSNERLSELLKQIDAWKHKNKKRREKDFVPAFTKQEMTLVSISTNGNRNEIHWAQPPPSTSSANTI
jgi:hypothetical protein